MSIEKETSLHRSLKLQYAGPRGQTEVQVSAFVCDGLKKNGEMIEIQTGSFGPLRDKVKCLCALGPVRIVHPIVVTRIIELYDTKGVLIHRRKSPRKGSIWDLFKVLLYAPEIPRLRTLTIELVLADILEKRVQDGKGSWRRKGVSIRDKELAVCRSTLPLRRLEDYRCFIPGSLGAEFTVKTLAEAARILPALAGKTLYVLTLLGVVERIRRDGRAWIYRRAGEKKERRHRLRS